MPEISRFYGIIVAMYFNDHPPPHFHVRYASGKAKIQIEPLELMEGYLSPRALALVMEWAVLHWPELQENWRLRETRQPLRKIDPLQ